MKTGQLIRSFRLEKGLTQKQLGELCGIAEPTIRRYELGRLRPKYSTLQKIADGLGVMAADLVDYSDAEQVHRVSNAVSEEGKEAQDGKIVLDVKNISKSLEIILATAEKENYHADAEARNKLQAISLLEKLTADGQAEALKRLEDLTYNPKYQKIKHYKNK